MLKKRMFSSIVIVACLALTLTACSQKPAPTPGTTPPAEKYPTKPITVLQGFAAGGGSDTLAKAVQPRLQKILGQNFVDVYKPGATGGIAWSELAQYSRTGKNIDGYTISITNTPMLQTNYMLNKDMTYTIADLAPIANIVTDPGVLVVRAESPIKTWQDFVDAAKKNPGKLTVGNSGKGGDDYFSILIVEKAAGIKVQQVEHNGDGPSWQAALGGHIDASSTNVGVTYPMIKAGKLRALAVYSEKRIPFLPDVPTLKELGVNVVAGSSRGYSAPKGVSETVLKTLADGMEKVVSDPEFKKAAEDLGLIVDFKKLDDYKKFLADEETRFKTIVAETGAQ